MDQAEALDLCSELADNEGTSHYGMALRIVIEELAALRSCAKDVGVCEAVVRGAGHVQLRAELSSAKAELEAWKEYAFAARAYGKWDVRAEANPHSRKAEAKFIEASSKRHEAELRLRALGIDPTTGDSL